MRRDVYFEDDSSRQTKQQKRGEYLKQLAVELDYISLRVFMNPVDKITYDDVVEDMIGLFEAIKTNSSDIKPYYSTKSNS